RRQITAILVLHRVQGRNHGRTLPALRKPRDPAVDFVAHVRGQLRLPAVVPRRRRGTAAARPLARRVSRRPLPRRLAAHRSISPDAMAGGPITATTSASMWPATISFIEARCAKPGARTLSRYGLLAPSETR